MIIEVRPALRFESFLETWFALGMAGKTNKKGMPNPLQLFVVMDEYRNEIEERGRLMRFKGLSSRCLRRSAEHSAIAPKRMRRMTSALPGHALRTYANRRRL